MNGTKEISFREKVLNREVLSGTWVVTPDSIVAEVIARSGLAWALLDHEHGFGDFGDMLHQLQAMSGSETASIVRVENNDSSKIKRVLELNPSGVMVPMVNDANEAERVVSAMRYPPEGIRGLTPLNRGSNFGSDFKDYFDKANRAHTAIVQIETSRGVENAGPIAEVDGTDVLFVGPMDLSLGMGLFGKQDSPEFQKALDDVANACARSGKSAGILVWSPEQAEAMIERGFTFIGVGSDVGILSQGLASITSAFEKFNS